jgi:hypothetical protein
VTISDSEMRSNEEHGVVAQKGACLTARGCRLALNLGAGALAVNQGSRAGVIGGQVTGNRVGLYAMDKGIVAEAEGCEIRDNSEVEIVKSGGQVLHPASRPQSVLAVPDPSSAAPGGRRR